MARNWLMSTIVLLVTCLSAQAEEAVTFPSLDGTTTLTSYVRRPVGEAPHPAVVLLHGCSGLRGKSGQFFSIYQAWLRTLTDAGYVALAVDSAGSRGFEQTCTPGEERRTMYRDRPKDAYAALQYLQAQGFVDPSRVAVMGWSQGGAIALLSINDKSIGRPPGLKRDFAAAITFYPGACGDKFQSKPYTRVEPRSWTSRIPLLVLFGEADVWTQFPPCQDFIEAARARGNPVELKSYPGAYHGFDAPNNEKRELPAYRTEDGRVPISGTDDAARADALIRVLAYLQAHLSTP